MTNKSIRFAMALLFLASVSGQAAVKPAHHSSGEGLFQGGFIKMGLMTSPDADRFGDKWIAAIGFDRMVIPYLAWGLEFQPYFRSNKYTDFKYSIFAGNLFLNIKGGYPVGKLVKALKFLHPLKICAGLGAGAELSVTSFTFPDDDMTKFKARFAWHMIFGAEYDLKKFGLILEIQPLRVIHSELEPSTLKYSYIMFGIRFLGGRHAKK
jgi:hypothetical protein